MFSIGMLITQIIYLIMVVVVFYALIVFIRLANRGIKALDIYIQQNEMKHKNDNDSNKEL